jgi:hypothetical protein
MKTNIFSNTSCASRMASAIFIFMLSSLFVLQASAQDQQGLTIKGTVIFSEDNQGAPGVNVYLKGSTDQGTYTDVDGAFEFPGLLHAGDVLVFSFIGRETVERVIQQDSNALQIIMFPDPIQMVEEPLVMGDQPRTTLLARVFRRVKK